MSLKSNIQKKSIKKKKRGGAKGGRAKEDSIGLIMKDGEYMYDYIPNEAMILDNNNVKAVETLIRAVAKQQQNSPADAADSAVASSADAASAPGAAAADAAAVPKKFRKEIYQGDVIEYLDTKKLSYTSGNVTKESLRDSLAQGIELVIEPFTAKKHPYDCLKNRKIDFTLYKFGNCRIEERTFAVLKKEKEEEYFLLKLKQGKEEIHPINRIDFINQFNKKNVLKIYPNNEYDLHTHLEFPPDFNINEEILNHISDKVTNLFQIKQNPFPGEGKYVSNSIMGENKQKFEIIYNLDKEIYYILGPNYAYLFNEIRIERTISYDKYSFYYKDNLQTTIKIYNDESKGILNKYNNNESFFDLTIPNIKNFLTTSFAGNLEESEVPVTTKAATAAAVAPAPAASSAAPAASLSTAEPVPATAAAAMVVPATVAYEDPIASGSGPQDFHPADAGGRKSSKGSRKARTKILKGSKKVNRA